MKIIQVHGNVAWQFYNDALSKRWIAVCAPMALTVEADTYSELSECINESIALVMKSLMKTGDLDKFLREHGWSKTVEEKQDGDGVTFDVPFELIAMEAAKGGHTRALH